MAVAAETRGPSGRRCEDWTRRENSSSRTLGSWLGITRSHRIRGWQGVHPVSQTGVHRDQQLAVDLRALIRGFRTPALRDGRAWSAFESVPRRKTRAGRGARSVGRDLLRIAAPGAPRNPRSRPLYQAVARISALVRRLRAGIVPDELPGGDHRRGRDGATCGGGAYGAYRCATNVAADGDLLSRPAQAPDEPLLATRRDRTGIRSSPAVGADNIDPLGAGNERLATAQTRIWRPRNDALRNPGIDASTLKSKSGESAGSAGAGSASSTIVGST